MWFLKRGWRKYAQRAGPGVPRRVEAWDVRSPGLLPGTMYIVKLETKHRLLDVKVIEELKNHYYYYCCCREKEYIQQVAKQVHN